MEPTISRKIIDDSWPRRWNICSIKESTKKTPNNINTTCRIETPQLRKIQFQRWELLVELLLLSCQRFWSLSTSRPSIDSQTVHNIWRITLNSFFPYLAGNNNKKNMISATLPGLTCLIGHIPCPHGWVDELFFHYCPGISDSDRFVCSAATSATG